MGILLLGKIGYQPKQKKKRNNLNRLDFLIRLCYYVFNEKRRTIQQEIQTTAKTTAKTIMGYTGVLGTIEETTHLDTMRSNCSTFFKVPHGKRETFTVYRGQLIVRNTCSFRGKPIRTITVYLYTIEHGGDLFCISANDKLKTIAETRHLIDKVLDCGTYL